MSPDNEFEILKKYIIKTCDNCLELFNTNYIYIHCIIINKLNVHYIISKSPFTESFTIISLANDI